MGGLSNKEEHRTTNNRLTTITASSSTRIAHPPSLPTWKVPEKEHKNKTGFDCQDFPT